MFHSEEQREAIFNQHPIDKDKVVDLLKLDDFYCLLSSLSSSNSTSSPTSKISPDQKIADITPYKDTNCSSSLDLESSSEDDSPFNPTITSATTALLDTSSDINAMINSLNMHAQIV